MPHRVIDTNVLLVANGSHADVSAACRETCVKQLLEIQKNGIVVIDDGYRILSEYQNKTNPNRPKSVGDVFLKWLLQNQRNVARVHQVTITELDENIFTEFPDSELEKHFDAPDRKFAAVANSHAQKPPILQAADCKWLDWWPRLKEKGVLVEFLCEEDACKFYSNKFPDKEPPKVP
ncbi:hypothetical protein [Rhizobium rhizoryzae]|uniref:PIN domain-containing protein n=1 Tax=Rhizobium rhizoryzae TaxID=451876 RepID=A0A7W6LHE9_9HYPH|nr:hypothetical protein [Rhizobium rhizoryzae]MBB4143242.1 hypothetical protein [Rhizobium rhizoryzae]